MGVGKCSDENPAFRRQRAGRPALCLQHRHHGKRLHSWDSSQLETQELISVWGLGSSRPAGARGQGAHLCLSTRIITTSWGQRWGRLNWKYPSFMELWPSRRPSRGNRQVVYERVSQRCVQREPITGTAGARDLAQGAKCPLESLSATLPTRDSSLPPVPITLRLIPLPWCAFCWFLLPAYLMSSRWEMKLL